MVLALALGNALHIDVFGAFRWDAGDVAKGLACVAPICATSEKFMPTRVSCEPDACAKPDRLGKPISCLKLTLLICD